MIFLHFFIKTLLKITDQQGLEKVVIIGGGPAGLTAAIYAARAGLHPKCFVGMQTTSQLLSTSEVQNYPGLIAQGPDIVMKMQDQAQNQGAELIYDDVQKVDLSNRPFKITYGFNNDVLLTQALIIATGADAIRLDVPGEKLYWQHGISACAQCDSMMARNKECYVVGGGDVACEEALHLANIASKVTMILRRDQFRASKVMEDRVRSNPKINIMTNSEVVECKGDKKSLQKITILNNQTQKKRDVKCQALYWAVGHKPNTSFLDENQIKMSKGYIDTNEKLQTSVPGVFAAGDCQDHIYRQAIVAAGAGCQAALECEKFLSN